jgi:hypothetical protein
MWDNSYTKLHPDFVIINYMQVLKCHTVHYKHVHVNTNLKTKKLYLKRNT